MCKFHEVYQSGSFLITLILYYDVNILHLRKIKTNGIVD